MKIIFFGTPEFACFSLEALINDPEIEIAAVVTQPDKPAGRKHEMTMSAVKKLALKNNLSVIQPKTKTGLFNKLKNYDIDFFVVIAYGMILKQEVLQIPKKGCINVHGSILPAYRGASPIQAALLHNDPSTGISIMKMDHAMDHGDVFKVFSIPVEQTDNTSTLGKKLALLSAEKLPQTLKEIFANKLFAQEQDHKSASYCGMIEKNDGQIKFTETAQEISNKLRAFTPWPGVFFEINNKKFKLIEIAISKEKLPPKEIKFINKELLIGTTSTALEIKKIQPEGKNIMTSQDFINGNQNLLKDIK